MTRIPAAQIDKAVPTGHTIPFTVSGRAIFGVLLPAGGSAYPMTVG